MPDPREALTDRLADDLETFALFGEIDPVEDAEIEAVLAQHEAEFDLPERYETYGETYIAAQLIFQVFERHGIALRHAEKWADADRTLENLANRLDLNEETRDQLSAVDETIRQNAPAGYDELLEAYGNLTDGLLNDLSWMIEGDRHGNGSVRVICELDGQRFERGLDAGETVDVDGLVELLNHVVAETTDDDRRFTPIPTWISTDAHIFFVEDVQMFENYFSFARASLQRKAHEERN